MRCGCLSLNTGKMNSKIFNGACNWIFLNHVNFHRSLVALAHLCNLVHSLSIYRALFFFHSHVYSQKSYQFGVTSRLWLIFIFFFFFIAAFNLNFIAFTVCWKLAATETTAMNVNGEQQSKKNELCSGTKKFLWTALFCFQLYLINNTSRWISFNCFYCCKCYCWYCCGVCVFFSPSTNFVWIDAVVLFS